MHEAQFHKRTAFITLTYRNDSLPNYRATSSKTHRRPGRASAQTRTVEQTRTHETRAHVALQEHASLSRRDLQLFTKRLNEAARRRFGNGVRYYACGEYGERTHRPHYHIAVYGEDFSDDRQRWKRSKSGAQLWRSSRLSALWPQGGADIGELTFESAAYVARYIMKKVNGPLAAEHYRRTDENGNDYWLEPEFSVMSRGGRGKKGGLGRQWFDAYHDGVYPVDQVIVTRGHKRVPSKPPRYYDTLLKALKPLELELVKSQREILNRTRDNSPARLRAGEAILNAKLKQLKRPLE